MSRSGTRNPPAADESGAGSNRSVDVSFEFFPPQTPESEDCLWQAVKRLEPIRPRFVSVTYGAGGATRDRTHATLRRILDQSSLTPAAHLTCIGASRDDVDDVVRAYASAGIRHIVALRGDPPGGAGTPFDRHPQGYANASELVAGISRIGGFEISVAAFPEKHPESASFEADIAVLQAKIDAGATRAITQFFYDNAVYFRFLDRVRARGIGIPIIPGLLPISDIERVQRFAARCGTRVSPDFAARFDGIEDSETRMLVGAAVAAEQVAALSEQGVTEFHFYTLNRAELVYAMCRLLGLGSPGSRIAA